MVTAALLSALALLWIIFLAQQRYHVLQYMFFLRFLLILWLAVFFFPIVALSKAGASLLHNLFALQGWQISLVVWLAITATLTIASSAELLFQSIADPFDLPFKRKGVAGWNLKPLLQRIYPFRKALYGLIAIPNIWAVWSVSSAAPWSKVRWIALGILFATACQYVSGRIGRYLKAKWDEASESETTSRRQRAGGPVRHGLKRLSEGIHKVPGVQVAEQGLTRAAGHLHGVYKHLHHPPPVGELVFASLLYLAGFFMLNPEAGYGIHVRVPALAYLLLVTILLAMLLPALSYYLDRLRVPVIAALVVVSAIFYVLSDSDHYFRVSTPEPEQQAAKSSLVTPMEVLHKRLDGRPEGERCLVVVAASGGGICAALWTAHVLVGLRSDPQVGEVFGKSLGLVSAVSGGSVGTMYFVDRYSADAGPPPVDSGQEIIKESASSTLGALGWGIAYPDLWRILAPEIPFDHYKDRAWAQEEVWGQQLESPEVTLMDWASGARDGWRPMVIFNATLSETGERLLLANVALGRSLGDLQGPWGARSFHELYPGKRLRVVTAARLSATFPYVSPIARASVDGDISAAGYHVADGGYFDNFGVVSAIEFIRSVLPTYISDLRCNRILFIQIRLTEPVAPAPEVGTGWLSAVVGPITTLAQVRTSTQILRNDLEVRLLQREAQSYGVRLESIVFPLADAGPLSWHLSRDERRAIDNAWQETLTAEPYRRTVEFLRQGA